MRRPVQIIFLLVFTLLFFFLSTVFDPPIIPNFFFHLDPLLILGTILASKKVVSGLFFSLLMIGLTLIAGRFFCGYICPMGTLLDLLPSGSSSQTKKDLNLPLDLKNIKYYFLIIFIASAAAGLSIFYLLDPLVILSRFYAFFLYPLITFLSNLTLDFIRPLARHFNWTEISYQSFPQPFFYLNLIAFLIFTSIIALNFIRTRFWCRFLCPLGALFSIVSHVGIVKREVSDACNTCLVCRDTCPMGAMGDDPVNYRTAECIQCLKCMKICPQEAISFKPRFSFQSPVYSRIDISRRNLVFSLAGGLGISFLTYSRPSAQLRPKRLIRPPGAIPEKDFIKSCIRCGQCMNSCLTNTLQPSLFEAGFSGLWTPRMDLRFAGCEQNCNLCGQVCPTQAIRPLNLDERRYARVGTAVIHKEICLVWEQDKLCLICDERCPYNAIVFKVKKGVRRPFVQENKCNGCGLCQEACPVEGKSAIVVYPLGEIRLKEGSYLEAAGENNLSLKKNEGFDQLAYRQPLFFLLPVDVNGFKKTEEAKIYNRKDLFNYINGAAEFYLDLNFNGLIVGNYQRNNETLTVELYQMGSPEDAFRVFLHDTSGETTRLENDWVYSSGFLKLRKQEYYLKIFSFSRGDSLKKEIVAMGKVIETRIVKNRVLTSY